MPVLEHRLKAIQHPEWPQGKAGRLGVADLSPDNNIPSNAHDH